MCTYTHTHTCMCVCARVRACVCACVCGCGCALTPEFLEASIRRSHFPVSLCTYSLCLGARIPCAVHMFSDTDCFACSARNSGLTCTHTHTHTHTHRQELGTYVLFEINLLATNGVYVCVRAHVCVRSCSCMCVCVCARACVRVLLLRTRVCMSSPHLCVRAHTPALTCADPNGLMHAFILTHTRIFPRVLSPSHASLTISPFVSPLICCLHVHRRRHRARTSARTSGQGGRRGRGGGASTCGRR